VCKELSKASWLFRPRGIESVSEGYEMAIRRFDKLLADVNVFPVEAVGKPFDSRTMRAIDKRSEPDQEKGVVLEELVGGFVSGDDVIRISEVIVNEE
jgi:molecular chaperone GrpE (heat shock protein)